MSTPGSDLTADAPEEERQLARLRALGMTENSAMHAYAVAAMPLSAVSLCLGQRFGARSQEGGTCYANAIAAVLHLAMRRIVQRVGGYPDFIEIRDKLIDVYGTDGANTLTVLQEVCPQYRLQCEEVELVDAMKAVAANRPVVARFRLTDAEWDSFSQFYGDNPCGILTKSEVDIRKRPPGAEDSGHAVVLCSYNTECLKFMNSWGSKWADDGFFRIKNAGLLGLEFVDVFWTLDDLKQEEKDAYARYGPEEAENLLTSLQGLVKLF